MVSQIGSGGTDVIGDEEQLGSIDVVPLEFEVGGEVVEGTNIAVAAPVSDLTFDLDFADGEGAIVTGKSVSDSTFNIKESGVLALQNKKSSNLEIKAEGNVPVELRVSGKFTGSSVEASPGKQKDKVDFQSGAQVKNSSFDLGKGKDTFKIQGQSKLKGTNTVDLGKGKDKDKIVIGESVDFGKKATLVIENMDKKDKVKIGSETFKKKDINNGDAPGFIELG